MGFSSRFFAQLNLVKAKKVELAITQIIREDANLLYGFLDANEQKDV